METIKESIDVQVPVSTAYDQWTQFEQFPKFMESVESVAQIDETHLDWTADIGGARREGRARFAPGRRRPEAVQAARRDHGCRDRRLARRGARGRTAQLRRRSG